MGWKYTPMIGLSPNSIEARPLNFSFSASTLWAFKYEKVSLRLSRSFLREDLLCVFFAMHAVVARAYTMIDVENFILDIVGCIRCWRFRNFLSCLFVCFVSIFIRFTGCYPIARMCNEHGHIPMSPLPPSNSVSLNRSIFVTWRKNGPFCDIIICIWRVALFLTSM